jgi:dipeptidyl aminopeptidase/acylaminoacyl peptidase
MVLGGLLAVLVAGVWLHRVLGAPRVAPGPDPSERGIKAVAVRLPTERGRTLFAWYCPPPPTADGRPAPAFVAIHGWGGGADDLMPLAGMLQRHGWGALLIETRCHGRSDGDTFASMPRFAEDASHAVDWLKARPGIDAGRVALIGHSVGAAAALLLGSRRADLCAVIAVASFAHPEEVMRGFLARLRLPYRPLGWLINRYVERIIGHRFDDIAPLTTVTRQRAPVLLMHGTADRLVPVGDMGRLTAAGRAAGRAVTAVAVPGVDHQGFNAETGETVLDWGAEHVRVFLTEARACGAARPMPAPGSDPVVEPGAAAMTIGEARA